MDGLHVLPEGRGGEVLLTHLVQGCHLHLTVQQQEHDKCKHNLCAKQNQVIIIHVRIYCRSPMVTRKSRN